MITTTERPALTFGILGAGKRSAVLATRSLQVLYGEDDLNVFKKAGKHGEDVPADIKYHADNRVYGKLENWFGLEEGEGKGLWDESLSLAISTHKIARVTLFPHEERRATLTTNIVLDRRPSSVLARLTTSKTRITEQCRYEQGLVLALGWSGVEVISGDRNSKVDEALRQLDQLLEKEVFVGKTGGDDKNSVFYSFHAPHTNLLYGLSEEQDPDPAFGNDVWVKRHEEPIRNIGLRSKAGHQFGCIPALYDPDEKDLGATLLKAWQRSLKNAGDDARKGRIQTSPYREDAFRLRIVPLVFERQQEYLVRDHITDMLEELAKKLPDYDAIKSDDTVSEENGDPNRFITRRRKIFLKGSNKPIEMMIQGLSDYIRQLYEVGEFDPELGRHNGSAHPLYKLGIFMPIADSFWPQPVFGINLREAQKQVSNYHAFNLGVKKRIRPSGYGNY